MALEKKGVPTAYITTDEFAFQASSEARMLRMGQLPIATVPHPLVDNEPETVMKKAAVVAGEIVKILTTPAEPLGEAYRNRYLQPPSRSARSQVIDCSGKCDID